MEKSKSCCLYFKLSGSRMWVGAGGEERGQSTMQAREKSRGRFSWKPLFWLQELQHPESCSWW